MLGLVIWKLVTCLGSHDEGCLLWGLISSFLPFSFFFVVFFFFSVFYFILFLFLFIFIFIFLPFICFQIWKNPKYCWKYWPKLCRKKGIVRTWKIGTVRPNHGSHGSLLFSHRAVLVTKKTAKLRGLRFFRSDCTIWSGFQNPALDITFLFTCIA